MSRELATYIDELLTVLSAHPREEELATARMSAQVRVTPIWLLNLALALRSDSVVYLRPLRGDERAMLREVGADAVVAKGILATAKLVVPECHGLRSAAVSYDGYTCAVGIRDCPIEVACAAVGAEVCLPCAGANWVGTDTNAPPWMLATFPSYGYALLSSSYLRAGEFD